MSADKKRQIDISRFVGDDVRLKDYLIEEARANLQIKRKELASFLGSRITDLTKISDAGQTEGKAQLSEADNMYVTALRGQIANMELDLEELEKDRAQLIEKNKPKRLQ